MAAQNRQGILHHHSEANGMKAKLTTSLVAMAGAMILAAPVTAAVTDINDVMTVERHFNDFPGSLLFPTYNYPAVVEWAEVFPAGGQGGFANQHQAWLSSDGGTSRYSFQQAEKFTITTDVTINAAGVNMEGGFRYDTANTANNIGEGLFIVKSNQEVAAFGANLPFFSFGGAGSGAYTLGDTVTLGLTYDPIASTIEYLYDDDAGGPNPVISSGAIPFAVDNPNFLNGSNIGVYSQPNPFTDGGSGTATYENFSVVPEPASLALLAIGALAAIRRRR